MPQITGIFRGKAKLGSLQQFVHALSSCEDMGCSKFPVKEVHKIAVLDMRLANTDRNGANILVCRGENNELKLVPIDHGYCLPENVRLLPISHLLLFLWNWSYLTSFSLGSWLNSSPFFCVW